MKNIHNKIYISFNKIIVDFFLFERFYLSNRGIQIYMMESII